MDLVDSSLSKVWSTDVEAHGEPLDDDGSDLQDLPGGSYRESKGAFKSSPDVEMGALPGCSHAGDVVGLEVIWG